MPDSDVSKGMMTDMRYLFIPLAAIVFAVGFAYTAFAAEPATICPMIYQPVCAAHQVECIKAPCYPVYQTYANSCTAQAAQSPVIHEGECTAGETGPVKPQPPYTPPAGCTAWFDGCNYCSKQDGRTICTMRACMVYNILPGKCTAYAHATTTPSGATSTPAATSTNPGGQITGTSSTSLTPAEHGIFHRLLDWFRHLLRF